MGQIDFTNIIVDDFRKGKLNPFNKYIYILTHIHSDHLRGLSNSWDYGPIYCSKVTASLILNKFPNLKSCLHIVPLQVPYRLTLADGIFATITFFDANHCAGSVMVLFEGYFGRFLYTGDFRFDKRKFSSYSYLYPPQIRNQKFQKCCKQIDKLWLDNTFCNPRFKFMAQKEAIQIQHLNQNQKERKKIYIGMDYYGKQQVLVHIAKKFQVYIVVDQQRYENLIAMQFDRQLFTTNPEQGSIIVVQKPKLHDKLIEDPTAIGLVMSGWCLQRQWRKVKGTNQNRIYYIPYSLHCNFDQIVSFVKSVKPSFIEPIVSLSDEVAEGGNISTQSMYNTEGNSESFSNLVKNFTSQISQTYNKNLHDKQFQEALKRRLGLDRKSAQINRMELGLNTVSMPARGKGYKLTAERDQEQIKKVKQQYKKRRENKHKQKQVVIKDDSDIQSDSDVMVVQKQKINPQSAAKETIKQREPEEMSISQEQQDIAISKPDWSVLNKIQIISGEKQIEENLKIKIKEIIKSLT